MININIKGYCKECPYFEEEMIDHIVGTDGIALQIDHEIVCQNKDACEYAIAYVFGK